MSEPNKDTRSQRGEPVHDLSGIPAEIKEKNPFQGDMHNYTTDKLYTDKDEFFSDELKKRKEEQGNK